MSNIFSEQMARQQRIDALMDLARYGEALAEIGSILGIEPENYKALCQKSLCHYNLREFQVGYDTTKAAIAADPESEWAYRLQSLIFSANGEHKSALQTAEIAMQKAPYSFESRLTLFYAQTNYGQLEEARKTLAAILELAPDSENAHLAAGLLALKDLDLTSAEEAFLKALKINAESVNALKNLGVVYLEMAKSGRGEKYRKLSVVMFERAVRSQPTFKLGQTNIKAANERPKTLRRSAGIFITLFFLISSPLPTILYIGFSDQVNTHTSYVDLFSPLIGGTVLIVLNMMTIFIVAAFGVFGLWYYLINDTTRIPSFLSKAGFWCAGLATSLLVLTLYLILMFDANTDIYSFPGIAVRNWVLLLIISCANVLNLRNGSPR